MTERRKKGFLEAIDDTVQAIVDLLDDRPEEERQQLNDALADLNIAIETAKDKAFSIIELSRELRFQRYERAARTARENKAVAHQARKTRRDAARSDRSGIKAEQHGRLERARRQGKAEASQREMAASTAAEQQMERLALVAAERRQEREQRKATELAAFRARTLKPSRGPRGRSTS